MKRRKTSAPSGGKTFPDVEIPKAVLRRARGLDSISRSDVVEAWLREQHGPEPDPRHDRPRYEAYLDATEGRAFDLLASGALDDGRLA